MTLPRLATTLPYRAQANRVSRPPAYWLPSTKSFSAQSFVAP